MKKIVWTSIVGLAAGILVLSTSGCDWSSSGSSGSFNTSQGAGINVNFSGFYRGELSGGKAVERTANGNILTFTISQVGNRITVTDNQGSTYSGSVGSPGLVAQPSGGVYPPGAELVQGQISFSGKDEVAARDIEFAGIIRIVTVTDVQGKTTTRASGSSSSSGSTNFNNQGSSSTTPVETRRTFNDGTNTTVVTVLTVGSPGDPFFSETTTTVVFENSTGREISRNTTVTRASGSGSGSDNSRNQTSETVETTEFSISENNTQYRLEGTWIEKGGGTSPVRARSAGSAGSIVTEETTEAAPVPTAQVTFFN
jgi:hypothetical protein